MSQEIHQPEVIDPQSRSRRPPPRALGSVGGLIRAVGGGLALVAGLIATLAFGAVIFVVLLGLILIGGLLGLVFNWRIRKLGRAGFFQSVVIHRYESGPDGPTVTRLEQNFDGPNEDDPALPIEVDHVIENPDQ